MPNPWPQECTAQAFAWLDHCIDTDKIFADTVVDRLNSTTNKKHFSSWSQVWLHMANYAKRQVDDQTSPAIRAKLDVKYLKIEDDDEDIDDDVNMGDDESDHDQSTIVLSSQSEFVGDGSQESSDDAGPSTSRTLRKKRPQSSTVELPPPKRARLAAQIRQSRDLGEDELSVETPSHEGFVRRSLRPVLPAKSPQPRRSIEQEQERPHSVLKTALEPTQDARTQDSPEQGDEQNLRTFLIDSNPPRQVHIQGLENHEQVSVFHRTRTIPESPQGAPPAEQATESHQVNIQASSTMAPRSRYVQSQNKGAGTHTHHPLVEENARLWKMFTQERNEKLAAKEMNSTFRMILSSPANHEQLLRTRYLKVCDRVKSRDKMNDDLREVERGLPSVRDGHLSSRFNDLQLAIQDACDGFSLLDLKQTLTASGNDVTRDKKIELLSQTAFSHGSRALNMSHGKDEDVDFFRGLVTAHIFHFVFESDFPSRYTGHDSSAIATAYRKICFEQEGAKALYTKERVAYQSYLEEKHVWHLQDNTPFHDLVRTKAELLAREVAELLAPLSMPTNVVADCLSPIYVDALKLKADMAMSNKTYTARFVWPGEKIEPESMVLENRFDRPDAGEVKQCVFPIIYAKPPRHELDDALTELSECLINYKNFAVSEHQYGRRSWSEGETTLSKGVMIL
ncbi:hypothetical protein PG984_015661 [Apiospora sp. TS-2023a]